MTSLRTIEDRHRRRWPGNQRGARIRPLASLTTLSLALLVVGSTLADQPRFPAVDHETAWELLPKSKSGERSGPLPVWARTMVRSLPTNTAALLELEHAQRVDNPLDPRLRAAIRWTAARANGSRYAEQIALADWVRAGGKPDELETWAAAPDSAPEKVRRVLRFTRRMCEAAYEVTDADVQALLDDRGPADLCAIALTVAYANFQDRLFVSLGLDQEDGGTALPAVEIVFDWADVKEHPPKAPPRETPPPPADAEQVPTHVDDEEWNLEQFDELQELLATQKARAPRIPLPPDEIVERNMPPGNFPPGAGSKIKWNCVGYGYQPKLTEAWFLAMRRFREDAALPSEGRMNVFWVVTRSNWCFY